MDLSSEEQAKLKFIRLSATYDELQAAHLQVLENLDSTTRALLDTRATLAALAASLGCGVEDVQGRIAEMVAIVREVDNELYRVVDEQGHPLHLNRLNRLYQLLKRIGGDDYWEKNPMSTTGPKIVMRLIHDGTAPATPDAKEGRDEQ